MAKAALACHLIYWITNEHYITKIKYDNILVPHTHKITHSNVYETQPLETKHTNIFVSFHQQI